MQLKVDKRKFDKAIHRMDKIADETRNATPGQIQKNGANWLNYFRAAYYEIITSIIPDVPKEENPTNENDPEPQDD